MSITEQEENMSITVKYWNKFFNLDFIINGDKTITLLQDETKGAMKSFVVKDRIFIVGGRIGPPRFSENQRGERFENDISYINRNVHCFDWNGELLWKIQPPHVSHLADGGCKYSMQPHTSVCVQEGIVRVFNWNGWRYNLDIDTGAVTPVVEEGEELYCLKKS